ncbi:MAG TPA: DUF58 domain-containing protein [Terriglobales bacterium]|nr:DUF58 domain-containing protein [Terriglobales bacterium]
MSRWFQSVFGALEREAWVRFFAALFGLALAFAAALFSTVTKDAGNVLGTAVLASAALLLSGWVALTTVPYLARRVALTRVRDALDYDVTREGLIYMVIVLVIGVAALNTGNNLLFIIVSAMLAAIIVSGVASAAMLRRAEMDLTIPEHVFANDSVVGRVNVHNRSRWWPAFSVSVVPPKVKAAKSKWVLHRSLFRWPPKAPPEKQWLKIPDLYLSRMVIPAVRADILKDPVYFPYIPKNASASAEVDLTFAQRGRFVQDGFGIATRFPFSFLTKTRRISLKREVIVYPPIEPTDDLFQVLPMITGEFESFVAGRGYDLYRIREYLPEDSARHVDWKATAKTGALKVREFTKEDERKLRIVFDNPGPGVVTPEQYEKYIALAASLGWHFSDENTELSFAADEVLLSSDIYGFLRYLALVQPRKSDSLLETLPLSDDYNVIFTARPRGSIPTPLWNCSYFIFFE